MNTENKKVEISELLAEIVRKNNGCIVLNIFESGSQYVEHVENQYIGKALPIATPHSQRENSPCAGREKDETILPEALATEQAMEIWKKVQDAGYVDANYQPLLSRTQSALLADAMAEKLGIRPKWKTFETLWNRKNMRSDYNLALRQQQSLDFLGELKRMI